MVGSLSSAGEQMPTISWESRLSIAKPNLYLINWKILEEVQMVEKTVRIVQK